MEFLKEISWEQGLFLQPQHFQLLESHHNLKLSNSMQLVNSNFWGSERIVIDKASLGNCQLSINSGSVLFKSGVFVNIGENAKVVTRSFIKTWEDRSKPLKIFIGLKKISEHGCNVTNIKNWNDISTVQSRYAVLEQPELIKDFYFNGPDAFIKQQVFVLRLIWEHELDDALDYEMIQIAQISQRGDNVVLDNNYIPSCFSIKSYHQLNNLIKDLCDDLTARANQLDMNKFPAASHDNVAVTRQWMNLLALQIFNRYIPLITHLLSLDKVSPADCYSVLLQLAGELKTFKQDDGASLEGIVSQEKFFPDYNHNELTEIFNGIRNIIFKLCDNITFVPHRFFSFDLVNDLFSVDLPGSAFTPRTNYYLRIHINERLKELNVIDFISQLKVGSIVSINTIIERSLSGIPFEILDKTPAGVPKDSLCVYCQLNSTVDEWRSIVSSHSIAVFGAEEMTNVKIDFVTVRV